MSRAFALRHIFQDAAETTGNGTVLNVAGLSRLGIQVAYAALGSASASASASPSASLSPSTSPSAPPTGAGGTVDFECTIDGSTWYALACTPSIGGTAVINTAAPGLWLVTVAGLSLVRCRITDIVTGSITVSGIGTVASA